MTSMHSKNANRLNWLNRPPALLWCNLILALIATPLFAQTVDRQVDVASSDHVSRVTSGQASAERSELPPNGTSLDQAVQPRKDTRPSSSDIPSLVRMVRPSIALILTPTGHGTGSVIHSDGWVMTSYHVIEDAPWDSVSGFQIVRVYLGSQTPDGFSLMEPPIWGKVFKTNRRADLALLQLTSIPEGLKRFSVLQLASSVPPEGSNCYAIGMPARGVLWAVRSGTIAGHGELPGALNDHFRFGANLALDKSQLGRWQRVLARDGERLVTLSTCGINPGDSGGPLLNSDGQLVGVTYAVPSEIEFKEFGYHVHLDEVREFLSDLPSHNPIRQPPSSLRKASNCVLYYDSQPGADSRLIRQVTLLRDKKPVAYFFDVDRQPVDDIAPEEVLLLGELDLWRKCGIEWAVTHDRIPIYFFDLDTNGEIDSVYIVVDEEGDEVCRFKWSADKTWLIGRANGDFLDTEVQFENPQAQARYQESRRNNLPSLLRR